MSELRQMNMNGTNVELVVPPNPGTSGAIQAPALKLQSNTPTAQGGVSNLNVSLPNSSGMISELSFTLDNSAGSTTKSYLLFDAIGAVAAATGGSYNAPDSASGIGNTAIKASLVANALRMSGVNYRITTGSAAQFSQNFNFLKAAQDGRSGTVPIPVSGGIRNTQYNDKVLTLQQPMLVDQFSAINIVVAANTVVVLTFYVDGQYNSF